MSGPRNAEERLRLLLVMLPWLMERGEVPLQEVAARFGVPVEQVAKDLELVAMCGLPPYVDEMIDVFIDDGIVVVGVPRLFTRPLRLTAPEAFTLLAAARTAMELPGADPDGPLARGLSKVAAALGAAGLEPSEPAGGDDTTGVVVELTRPPLTDDLVDATARGAELEIAYYSPARDETSDRVVVPRHVFAEGGHWYLLADDDRSGERRTFRIDRIESARATGAIRPADESVTVPERFFTDRDLPRATIRVAPSARWMLDPYPIDEVTELERPPGWVQVTLPVGSERWLQRLLIRLGPQARLVSPADATRRTAELARRILRAYET